MKDNSKLKSDTPEHPRVVKSRNGVIKKDRLAPIVYHDNRNGGSLFMSRNQMKRDKRALRA
jgi:hypothetical protein